MRTHFHRALLCACLFLCGCASAPRTTTAEERGRALETVALVEATVTAAHLLHKISPEDYAKASASIEAVRAAVIESETTPVSSESVALLVLNLAAQWLPAKQ